MSDDIKLALKEARNLVKGTKYVDAIKKCKNILKRDRGNYSALVLLGAAMMEVEEHKVQTPLVLRKAIDLQPENPLAWQALMTYYERTSPDAHSSLELAAVYCQIAQLDLDFGKFSKLLNKITDLLYRFKDNALFSQVVGNLIKLREDFTEEKRHLTDKVLVPVLIEYPNMEMEYVEFLVAVLASVVKDGQVANRREYFAKYLTLLYKTSQITTLVNEAKEMHRIYPEDVLPLEWICRIYYEQYIFSDIHEDVSQFYDALLVLQPDSMAGLIAKSVYLMETGNVIESRDRLKYILSKGKTSLYIWFALSEVYSRLYCWEEAENAGKHALDLHSTMPSQLKRRLETTLIESLANSKCETKWKSVVSMCTKMLAEEPSSDKLKVLRARAEILLDRPEALDSLTALESREESRVAGEVLRALYLRNRGLLAEAAKILVGSAGENSSAWLLLGKVYWEMAEFSDSHRAFLNAVRLDRNNWECFVRLGRYYAEQENDPMRSKRCYQMALRINPSSEEAGIGLCTMYRLLNNTEANVQLLLRITAQEKAPKWAWLQLGLQHLDGDASEPVEAIRALQCAIRADPNDNHSWESLADAYWARGAYTSALRSYQRALELSPGSIYPAIQLANIKLTIGQHEEAANDFQRILHEGEERYVPALKGLAEARLALAKENIRKHFLCRARENVQDAVDSLTIAIVERNDISCLWKILADAFHVAATMPDRYCRLTVMSAFVEKETIGMKHAAVAREELFSLSSRCYSRALSISRDSALLWHNLACSYFARSHYCLAKDGEGSREVIDKALAAAKQAVTLSRSSWLHWNLLGIICMSDQVRNYALAQHCFVMAIDVEPNNAPCWSNLGTLYLRLGEPYKANEAFSRAQRADPAYINSWIGQALIAEEMRNKEAMDLFRHSMELGYHDQAALGYAHWVLSVLLDPESKKDPLYTYIVEKMHAVQVATDALHWYNERQRDNCYALNAHGLLLERSRLYTSAGKSFEEAMRVCESGQNDGVRVNLARIYVETQRHAEAVRLCRAVNEATFTSQCQLALTLFKAGSYEESYSAYETALQWLAKDGAEKANVLCAMAAIAHIFQGAEDAKTLLFQCLQIQPPLVAGFLAAAALGILHSDLHLATLVFDELKAFEGHPRYRRHVAALAAYFRLLQNDTVGSIRHLSKAIHRYPDDAGCWASLVRILAETDSIVLPRCVEKALFFSRKTTACSRIVAQIACASTTSHLRDRSTTFGLYSAQKTVFSFPGDSGSWANFIAVLPAGKLARQDSKANAQWLSSLISIVLKEQPATRNLKEWLILTKKMIDTRIDK